MSFLENKFIFSYFAEKSSCHLTTYMISEYARCDGLYEYFVLEKETKKKIKTRKRRVNVMKNTKVEAESLIIGARGSNNCMNLTSNRWSS